TTVADIKTAREFQVPTYFCPSRRSPPATLTDLINPPPSTAGNSGVNASVGDYAACRGDGTQLNSGDAGMFIQVPTPTSGPIALRFVDIVDGTSNTFAVGEKHVPRGTFNDQNDGAIFNGGLPAGVFRVASTASPLAFSPTDPYRNNFGS